MPMQSTRRLSGTSGKPSFTGRRRTPLQAKTMNDYKDFEIHYRFQGEPRHFNHQGKHMCESDALHFATLHAGVGAIEGHICAGPVRLALLYAEGLGVTQVQWKRT
jgi:hypothetical protein